jgi:DNA-binding NtrC family response regulator
MTVSRDRSVGHHDGKDHHWLKIGLALPHLDGNRFDVMLQALPLNARLVVRAIAAPESHEHERRSLARQVESFERALIERCLIEAGGNISTVMDRLDIPRRTLNEKMTRLGIDRGRLAKAIRPMSADESEQSGTTPPIPKAISPP